MNSSTLKILVPLVLLMGVVFAITYFSQYTPKEPDDKGAETAATVQKPLRFFSNARAWDPRPGASLMDREFPGFFEPGETQYSASFWFENRSDSPVTLQLLRVSCMSCSGGQVATIPPDVTKQILQMTAISMLPHGLATALPLGMAVPAAQLDRGRDVLAWQAHEFSKPPTEVVYTIPPAASGDPWYEQWAILDLKFKVRPSDGQKSLIAEFITRVPGTKDLPVEKFGIGYEVAEPFNLDRSGIDIGELTDASATQNHEIIVYSSTRKANQMPKVDVLVMMPPGVSGEPGEFVAAGKPIPVPEEQLDELAYRISSREKKGIRVQAALRIPITVKVKHEQTKLDIGLVERVIAVTQGSDTKQVMVKGSMRGPVYLGNGAKSIAFGAFAYSSEQTVTVDVETERTGVELQIVNDLTRPKFLKLELKKQPDIGERGSFKLRATIPANEQIGEIRDGVVVLEAKGPNPQRLRIPITGRGRD